MSRRVAALILGMALLAPVAGAVPCGWCEPSPVPRAVCCCPASPQHNSAPGTGMSGGCCEVAPAPTSPPQSTPAASQTAPPRPGAAFLAAATPQAPLAPTAAAPETSLRDTVPIDSTPDILLLDCSFLI